MNINIIIFVILTNFDIQTGAKYINYPCLLYYDS